DGDGELRDAVQEVRGAVERIDDPGMRLVRTLGAAAFLAEETVAGPRFRELGAQDLLGAMVGGADEIARSLDRDLEMLDLAEVALEAARGLAGGGDHHIEECGAKHRVICPGGACCVKGGRKAVYAAILRDACVHQQANAGSSG